MRISANDLEEQLERLCGFTNQNFYFSSWSTGQRRLHQLYLSGDEDDIAVVSDPISTREMYQFIEGYIELSKQQWD